MIDVNEAEKIIRDNYPQTGIETVAIKDALSQVLAEDIAADRDFPPAHKSLMDGIAINFDAIRQKKRAFCPEGVQAAGMAPLGLISNESCVEIMTGAVLPKEANCVIPVEQVTKTDDVFKINPDYQPKKEDFIQARASQFKEGDIVVPRGTLIEAPQIAVLCSVGKTSMNVFRKPKVGIVTTGNELKDIDEPLEDYEIRRSNSYFIQAALSRCLNINASIEHARDDLDELTGLLKRLIREVDILVLSGGVSMGKFDFVPEALNNVGIECLFHKVKQHPGKPLWVGHQGHQKLVLALPGNPVSTQVCTYRYVIPAIKDALGIHRQKFRVIAASNEKLKTDLTFFCPVKIEAGPDAIIKAVPVMYRGSSDVLSVGGSDGFIEVPEGRKAIEKGEAYSYYAWS